MISSATATPAETLDLICGVLRRGHQTMEAVNSPHEARAILHVAELFADELAAADPEFDRVQFIQDVTDDPS